MMKDKSTRKSNKKKNHLWWLFTGLIIFTLFAGGFEINEIAVCNTNEIAKVDELGVWRCYNDSTVDLNITVNAYVSGNITNQENTQFGIFNNGTCIVIGDLRYSERC